MRAAMKSRCWPPCCVAFVAGLAIGAGFYWAKSGVADTIHTLPFVWTPSIFTLVTVGIVAAVLAVSYIGMGLASAPEPSEPSPTVRLFTSKERPCS